MIQWFFDIPSKLIHWRLNLVRTLGAYVPWLRRDDGSMKVHAGTLVDLFATILSGRRHLSAPMRTPLWIFCAILSRKWSTAGFLTVLSGP